MHKNKERNTAETETISHCLEKFLEKNSLELSSPETIQILLFNPKFSYHSAPEAFLKVNLGFISIPVTAKE